MTLTVPVKMNTLSRQPLTVEREPRQVGEAPYATADAAVQHADAERQKVREGEPVVCVGSHGRDPRILREPNTVVRAYVQRPWT